ncbi:uncharacterized protein [Physcomitrium patens]|nr:uncharacterized protein LOC112279827 [Physcomitrium patens]|eukprot:XP_024370338.1 uncharacterized protein LOC112279827 [Physcomitrella patens]
MAPGLSQRKTVKISGQESQQKEQSTLAMSARSNNDTEDGSTRIWGGWRSGIRENTWRALAAAPLETLSNKYFLIWPSCRITSSTLRTASFFSSFGRQTLLLPNRHLSLFPALHFNLHSCIVNFFIKPLPLSLSLLSCSRFSLVNMACSHGDSAEKSLPEQHKQGAEHPSFLQKIKDKLHVGHKHNDEDAATHATTDSAISSKNATTEPVSASSVKEEPTAAKPPTSSSVGVDQHHHGRPTTDLSEPAGHESEHHGGVPTFMVALPDQDIPEEVAPVTASKTSEQTTGEIDSEEIFRRAQQGEHHHGVPTFLVALPNQDVPEEVTKETSVGQEGHADSQRKELDSEKLFSSAQQGEHHGGVPTFLVAIPDQEIPDVVNQEGSSANARHADGGEEIDSEKVFREAQQGEHHHGVPTFLVALPDEGIPDQVSKGVDSTADHEPSQS